MEYFGYDLESAVMNIGYYFSNCFTLLTINTLLGFIPTSTNFSRILTNLLDNLDLSEEESITTSVLRS